MQTNHPQPAASPGRTCPKPVRPLYFNQTITHSTDGQSEPPSRADCAPGGSPCRNGSDSAPAVNAASPANPVQFATDAAGMAL